MQYRRMGNTGWDVSVLGFGAMRLPVIDGDQSRIDEPEAIRMIRHAVDNGVNYIDTGYMYHQGNSERLVGKAVRDGYRQKTRIATKLPPRMCETLVDADRILDEQLQKLDIDKIDFYLFHGVTAEQWDIVKKLKLIDWAEKQMAAGKFDRLCFSFHDELSLFKEIIDSYDNWGLAQIQYNYMDYRHQAGREGVEYAASKGIPIVVMEPLHGGLLARKPPEPVAELWQTADRQQGPVEWAFQWLWSQPEVAMCLSGMSTMEQVEQNLELASNAQLHSMTKAELELIDKVRQAYIDLRPVKCTNCKYCQPCPNGVDIPGIFQLYDDSMMYNEMNFGRFHYNGAFGIPAEKRADNCTECGECLEKCPMHIEIPKWLKTAHEALYQEVPPQTPQ